MAIKQIYEVTHLKDNPEWVEVTCKGCNESEIMSLSEWITRTKYSYCRKCRKLAGEEW